HESKLAEVLQPSSEIPIAQATGAIKIDANHVYVTPPNRSLALTDGMLMVAEIAKVEDRRSPIDLFFRSLAEAQGAKAICVVLSGTGSDGSSGLKRVKENGGLVIAQDPADAEYEDMPRKAIATGFVDYVLPARAIPKAIVDYANRTDGSHFAVPPSRQLE